MSDDLLDQGKRVCDAATPGPWYAWTHDAEHSPQGPPWVIRRYATDADRVDAHGASSEVGITVEHDGDRTFILWCRENVPVLITRAEVAEAQLLTGTPLVERLAEALDNLPSDHPTRQDWMARAIAAETMLAAVLDGEPGEEQK